MSRVWGRIGEEGVTTGAAAGGLCVTMGGAVTDEEDAEGVDAECDSV